MRPELTGGLGHAELLDLVVKSVEQCETGVLIHGDPAIIYASAKVADLIEVPRDLTRPGVPMERLLDYCARRGDYGPGVAGAEIIARSWATIRSGKVLETERTTPSGRIVRARIAGLPDGGAIATYNDVSELVRAKQAAHDLARDLERRVVERTHELAEAKDKAEQASRAKTQFLANMSHELRTPLNAVIGFSEIIREDVAAGEVSDIPKQVDRVLNAARSLLGLINNVLDLTNIETGGVEARAEEVDAGKAAAAAVDAVAHAAGKNGASCQVVVAPGVGAVAADPEQLAKCLANLLSNAAKFSPGGRVTLQVRPDRIAGRAAIAFEIADDGVGIGRETLVRLFQPFMQADESFTRSHGGAGLGLSITRGLARLMGGDVIVQSELGKGSTFTLLLPAFGSEPPRRELRPLDSRVAAFGGR
ncbi:MAG: PAS-domain containing protein [Hyphomonadaceae bacterium]|nr:PAS-domain containing protein [Hyphomonadaceae bacterium]